MKKRDKKKMHPSAAPSVGGQKGWHPAGEQYHAGVKIRACSSTSSSWVLEKNHASFVGVGVVGGTCALGSWDGEGKEKAREERRGEGKTREGRKVHGDGAGWGGGDHMPWVGEWRGEAPSAAPVSLSERLGPKSAEVRAPMRAASASSGLSKPGPWATLVPMAP